MNLNHLYFFKTLAGLEHYAKAAKVLSISQPSLSYAIAGLERELGVPLFEKKGRNVVLTECGKAFEEYVSGAINQLEDGVQFVRKMNES